MLEFSCSTHKESYCIQVEDLRPAILRSPRTTRVPEPKEKTSGPHLMSLRLPAPHLYIPFSFLPHRERESHGFPRTTLPHI
jgi:hypothetical protein